VAGCGEQIEGVGEAAVFHKVQEIFWLAPSREGVCFIELPSSVSNFVLARFLPFQGAPLSDFALPPFVWSTFFPPTFRSVLVRSSSKSDFIHHSKLANTVGLVLGDVKAKCILVQALRLCNGRTAHRGSRGIALL
jgi:hypothetical protein